MFTVSSTLMWAVLTGPADWVCHIGTFTPRIEAVAWSCIIVTCWSGADGTRALSARPTGFLQCFDTVGLVIWPVKIFPDMTYNVFGGTLTVKPCSIYYYYYYCTTTNGTTTTNTTTGTTITTTTTTTLVLLLLLVVVLHNRYTAV